jgi:hypothetical protein
MAEDEHQDLRDIRAEETTRGKKQPKKALSLARRRMIAEMARMLQDPRCDKEPIWRLFASTGCKRSLTSFVSSSLCGGSAAETIDHDSMC